MIIQPLGEIQPIHGYHKVDGEWQPWATKPGFMYTAALLSCGYCGSLISGMGGPGGPDWMCVSCYEKEKLGNLNEK